MSINKDILPDGYTVFDLIEGLTASFVRLGEPMPLHNTEEYLRVINHELDSLTQTDLPKLREMRLVLNKAISKINDSYFLNSTLLSVKNTIIRVCKETKQNIK